MIRRPPRSTPIKSSAASDVYKRQDLVYAMKKSIEVKDRTKIIKNYHQCFVAQEAVNWMLQNLPIRDREEAVELANKLLDGKYISNVSEPGKPFKDNDGFFVFEATRGSEVNPEGQEQEGVSSASPDDFDVLQVVGKGGFGKVLRVKHKATNKIYAMKVMNKNKISGQRQLQCLIAEKNIMLNDNPFLVHLHYSFQTDDKLYFVMDFISGGDLAYHLEHRGRFNMKEIAFITAEIVLAMEHLHACGIVYRDLKLENILLDSNGHVCLTDFGLSKELETVSATTKTVCGTPTYLAPEVLLGHAYGNSIDWWSLGVVLYELFTGTNPFDAKDFDSVLQNILHSAINVPQYVPKEGKDLIEALLQRNPAKRLCSTNGSEEIEGHIFYKGIDWKKLMVKQLKPPFVPPATENFDASLGQEGPEPPEGRGPVDKLKFGEIDFGYESKSILHS
eukprot:TRINITY_DN1083_c0_g1_i3.p1 TRINITY_DN1083_c0_g1~~TRINITY_DN1083_c0_g1_i3.p1  ORF type:complete len:447 (-),score=163.82 TRINITY_DN1083_c0_g1_i3:60-1400(-)